MELSEKNLRFGLFFIFITLLLSNASSFFRVIWLIPQVVIVQSILFLILSAISIWLMYKEDFLFTFIHSLRKNWVVIPFLVFSLISIFWSIGKESSIFRWIIFLSTFILGGYFSLKYSKREIIKIVSVFNIMLLGLSTFFILTLPSLSIMHYFPYEGTWQGIFWHKNHMGLIVSLMNIIFLLQVIDSLNKKKQYQVIWGFLYIASLLFLYKTGAVGAYLTTIGVHGVFLALFLWMKFRHLLNKKHYIILIIVLLVFALIVFKNLDTIFGIFGRTSSLTGRIPMWKALYENYFTKRPYFGYGFNAFWYYYPHRSTMQSLTGWGNPPVISDNGFFDILINTGIVGFVLFCVFYLGLWYRSIKILRTASNVLDLFPVTFMAFTFIANLSFSLIFETEAYIMLLMMMLLFLSLGWDKQGKKTNFRSNLI